MMKMFNAMFLAATLTSFGTGAFADYVTGPVAEEIVTDGEVLSVSSQDYSYFSLLVIHRSKLYMCQTSFGSDGKDGWVACSHLAK
jgi:hypothetical protein